MLTLYRDHQAIEALFEEEHDEEEGQCLYALLVGIEHRMNATPALTAACMAAEVLVLTENRQGFDNVFEPALLTECDAIVAQVP